MNTETLYRTEGCERDEYGRLFDGKGSELFFHAFEIGCA